MNTYIIAEAGVNHNGQEDLALKLISAAKESGADAVKFQLFNADALTTQNAEQALYQKKNSGQNKSQYTMLKELELSCASFEVLRSYALKKKIDFIVTPFDIKSLNFVAHILDLPILKISSGDITNGPLLLAAAQTQRKIILSTGMSSLGEIEAALKVIAFGLFNQNENPTQDQLNNAYMSDDGQKILQEKVSLLHCTSEYPAPFDEVNLKAMDTLLTAFGLKVGLSDHSIGLHVPIAAVAREATIIEKHFTLDKSFIGPDHRASLDPLELTEMVERIRDIEKALGHGRKIVSSSEKKNMILVRRALVANTKINKGDIFSIENLGVKRPSYGISPMSYWDVLGKVAIKNYEIDEVIL